MVVRTSVFQRSHRIPKLRFHDTRNTMNTGRWENRAKDRQRAGAESDQANIMEEKNRIEIREEETLEDLQLNGLRLIQKKDGFRFGMDSVLLADFAKVRPTDRVADFGCGTGILPLLLIGRGKGHHFLGIEIQEEMAEMSRRTMLLNGLQERVDILWEDITRIREILPAGSVDAIVCNPPYGMPGQVMKNQKTELATARHQEPQTLGQFFSAAFHLLRGKGKIFLVYPAAQMFSLMTALRNAHLEPKTFRLVYPDIKHPANLVLMEGVKDGRPRLHPTPPLIIRNENGILTKELKSIYHMQD